MKIKKIFCNLKKYIYFLINENYKIKYSFYNEMILRIILIQMHYSRKYFIILYIIYSSTLKYWLLYIILNSVTIEYWSLYTFFFSFSCTIYFPRDLKLANK